MTRAAFILVLALLGSCVAPRTQTAPPLRAPEPRPVIRAAPPAPALDWTDRPTTPGDWRYQSDANASAALFEGASGRFGLLCDRTSRRLTLDPPAPRTTIRTSSAMRSVNGTALPANDPLLDAIAFTRGRFLVQRDGQPDLVLPAYAEVSRVIDDCRT